MFNKLLNPIMKKDINENNEKNHDKMEIEENNKK